MMKSLLFFASFLALNAAPLFAQLVTGNELIRIEARTISEQDRKDLVNTTADTITQRKSLQITLAGKAKDPENRTGKWIAYGHSSKGHDVSVLETGEFKLDLANPLRRQTVESKVITTTYTPEHSVVTRTSSSRSRRSTTRATKVEASGTKFAGFAVIIKDGNKIVGEFYDPSGLKQEAAK